MDDNSTEITTYTHGNFEGNFKHLLPVDCAAIFFMAATTVVTIFANLIVTIAILSNGRLRRSPTNFFIINLCVIDLISAFTVMPLSIYTYTEAWSWTPDGPLCLLGGLSSSFCIFASIMSICSICIERFYSIKLPMHHAAHCSFLKVLIATVFVWLVCGVLASLPLLGWNSYKHVLNRMHCSFTWDTDQRHQSFIVVIGCVCFILPGFILCISFCGIYKIAQKSVNQVHPVIGNIAPFDSAGESTESSEQSRQTTVNGIKHTQVNIAYQSDATQIAQITRGQNKRFKAAKVLLILLVMYLVFWGPYFIMQLVGIHHFNSLPKNRIAESITLWIGYLSFAANPFLYGWINSSIRESLKNLWLQCRHCGEQNSDHDILGDGNIQTSENFIQFLERTNSLAVNCNLQGAG